MAEKLKHRYEGKCGRYGYVRVGSLRVLQRSTGVFVKQHFNGNIRYEVVAAAEVCDPEPGGIFKAVIANQNALGIQAEAQDPERPEVCVLDVIVPRKVAGIASEVDLDGLQVGDEVWIKVLGKRFQLNDSRISVIAKVIEPPSGPTPPSGDGGGRVHDDRDRELE